MSHLRKTTAGLGVAALVAVPATTMLASPAYAADKSKRCDGARMELSVEKDDGRFEVEADIDNAPPGSRWRIVLRHDGKRFFNEVRRANREGDIEIDRTRRNTPGKDVFRMKANKVGTGGSCTLTVTRR
jgi:hypothetical protein